jgi:p-cumic alcohol dehydrogenase
MMSLDGKIAMVTGAATGIGAALAQALSSSGACVIGVDITWDGAEKMAGVEQAQCDVADPVSVKTCVADIEARHKPVDILINNAALASELAPTPFEHISPEEWMRVMTVNTMAPFLCSQAVAPRMRERKWGRIVNLTSATIFIGMPPMLHYVPSRGAIAIMTRGLARELGHDGITVNAIAPGLTMTNGIQSNEAYSDELIAQALAAQSIPTREQPEDLVAACLYLVSDGARMMTGQILVVDGGTAFH